MPFLFCLPSSSPDAKCWFECFFPTPKNACVCLAVAQRCELFACPQALQMLNCCFFPTPKNASVCFAVAQRPPELFACLQALQMLSVGFSQPQEKRVCMLRGRSEAPELFACPQALQMPNVGLSAFAQPRKTHAYALRSPRGPRVVCLPSGSPDAKRWFECFFPALQNAFEYFGVAAGFVWPSHRCVRVCVCVCVCV